MEGAGMNFNGFPIVFLGLPNLVMTNITMV